MISQGRKFWSAEEEHALRSAVEQYRAAGHASGVSWVGIKSDPDYEKIFEARSWQNLKDKWRNMRLSPSIDLGMYKEGMKGKERTTKPAAERDLEDTTHGVRTEKEDNFRRISLYVAGSARPKSSTPASKMSGKAMYVRRTLAKG